VGGLVGLQKLPTCIMALRDGVPQTRLACLGKKIWERNRIGRVSLSVPYPSRTRPALPVNLSRERSPSDRVAT